MSLPGLRVDPKDLPAVAIVVGDPVRAERAAERLDDAREIARNREYATFVGARDGRRLAVVSHGVGAAGANVCFEELLRGGVRTLVRAGTCGAIAEGIGDGELIVASGAVREDAVTDHLMPLAYPAAADRRVVDALLAAAAHRGVAVREGLVVTEANLYPGIDPPRWQRYVGYGVLGVEMELSALLVLAAMRGARAGGILAVDGNLLDRDPRMSDYDPHRAVVERGVEAMLEIALDAAAVFTGDAGGTGAT